MKLLKGPKLVNFLYKPQQCVRILGITNVILSRNSMIVGTQLFLSPASKALFYSIRNNLISVSAMISSVVFKIDYTRNPISEITLRLFEAFKAAQRSHGGHPEKIDSNFSQVDADHSNTTADEDRSIIANPLIKPLKWHSELYRRIRLLP